MANVDYILDNTDKELVGFEKMELPEKFGAKFWLSKNLQFHPATVKICSYQMLSLTRLQKLAAPMQRQLFPGENMLQSSGKMC